MKFKNLFLFLITILLFSNNIALALNINDKYIINYFHKDSKSITVVFKNEIKKTTNIHKDIIGPFAPNNKNSIFVAKALLKKSGYYTGDINGSFDSKFNMAILEFQKDYNLPQNGFISFDDWINMYNATLLFNN